MKLRLLVHTVGVICIILITEFVYHRIMWQKAKCFTHLHRRCTWPPRGATCSLRICIHEVCFCVSANVLRTVIYVTHVYSCHFHPSAALYGFASCWVTGTDQSNGKENESRHWSAPPLDLTKTLLNCKKSHYSSACGKGVQKCSLWCLF